MGAYSGCSEFFRIILKTTQYLDNNDLEHANGGTVGGTRLENTAQG